MAIQIYAGFGMVTSGATSCPHLECTTPNDAAQTYKFTGGISMSTALWTDANDLTIPAAKYGLYPTEAHWEWSVNHLIKDNLKCLRNVWKVGTMIPNAIKASHMFGGLRAEEAAGAYSCKLGSLNLGMMKSPCCMGAAAYLAKAASAVSGQTVSGMTALGIQHCWATVNVVGGHNMCKDQVDTTVMDGLTPSDAAVTKAKGFLGSCQDSTCVDLVMARLELNSAWKSGNADLYASFKAQLVAVCPPTTSNPPGYVAVEVTIVGAYENKEILPSLDNKKFTSVEMSADANYKNAKKFGLAKALNIGTDKVGIFGVTVTYDSRVRRLGSSDWKLATVKTDYQIIVEQSTATTVAATIPTPGFGSILRVKTQAELNLMAASASTGVFILGAPEMSTPITMGVPTDTQQCGTNCVLITEPITASANAITASFVGLVAFFFAL